MKNYSKIEIKGKGSYGQAFLMQNNTTNELSIIKIIDTTLMNKKQKENAINEASILKELKHPCIIRYQDSFIDKITQLCIVMEYADNGTLEQQIQNYKELNEYINESLILDWFTQLCLAIKYLHDRNIIHRDIKAQNIFLTKDNQIKLGDFGIAKQNECKEQLCMTSIGTPYYLSPEVFSQKPYNNKCDMWSLGCVLYELLSLRHAFDAKTLEGLGTKILRGQYPNIPTHYSEDLRNIVSKLLIVDSSKRLNINQLLQYDILKRQSKIFLDKMITLKKQTQMNQIGNSIEQKKNKIEQKIGLKTYQQLLGEIENNQTPKNIDVAILDDIKEVLQLEKQVYQK